VSHLRAVEEGVPATPGAIDELVADHHRPGLEVRPEATYRTWANDALDAQRGKGEKIGSEIDLMGRYGVVATVTRKEGHELATHSGQADGITWSPVGRVGPYLLSRCPQGVKA
jgi:hypothetical protein